MSTNLSHRPTVANRLLVRSCCIIALAFAVTLQNPTPCVAADKTFVGVLALAVEDDVATQIGLSNAVKAELLDLVDERESDALELAMQIRDLSPAKRAEKLSPFRIESEQMGLKLLSLQQQRWLEGIRVGRTGMTALSEPSVTDQLKLNSAQQQQVTDISLARETALSKLGGLDAKRTAANYERQLKAVLSPEQLVVWKGITNPKADSAQVADSTPARGKAGKRQVGEIVVDGKGTSGLPKNAKGNMRFSFRYAPWANVIEWFAAETESSLLMDAPPQGTFNYSDPREYTPAQAIDLLNSVLLTKGYTLVRREQMLMVVNLADGIPPNLISDVNVDDLDQLGEYELVKCLFTLRGVPAADAAEEITRLIGPQGKVNVLTSSNQLQITETAGRLRTFRKILEAGERKGDSALGSARLIQLKHVRASDVLKSWRSLMGLTEEENVSPDGSMRVAQGKTSRQLLLSGEPYRITEVEELVKLIDIPNGGGSLLDTPQLEVYPITEADPPSVLAVVQELFTDSDEIRLAIDPSTGSLVALASPAEQATIRATVQQLQADKRQVEVIRLRTVDPQLAMLSIEKLFGGTESSGEGSEPTPNRNAPRVDADPISRSLLIRASASQIEEIRELLTRMGEDVGDGTSGSSLSGGRGNLRLIPIDPATARRALQQMSTIWPNVRKNPIRTVRLSQTIRGTRLNSNETSPESRPDEAPSLPPAEETPPRPFNDQQNEPPATDTELRSVKAPLLLSKYVAQREGELAPSSDDGSEENNSPISEAENGSQPTGSPGPLPEVVVTFGEQGLLIASEDTEALDEFEDLFMTLADQFFSGSREMAIFYLRYAKSEVASEMLKQFISGGTASSDGGGTTLLGSIAGAALGNSGIGSMLGMGGGASGGSARISSGTTIIADPRLNAVIVQATPKELDFIQDFLKVMDKSNSPERIETIPRPRAIPVVNTDALAVADIVRSVYATRLSGAAAAGSNRQPSPEEFLQAMSGQKNTGKTISNSIQDQVRVTISVDERRNALLVVAPDSLFEEIQALVADLDFATPELANTVRYGRATVASPETIRSAIATFVGESQSDAKSSNNGKKSGEANTAKQKQPGMEEMKRRMDFFKSMQNRAAKQKAVSAKKAKAAGKKK